MQHTGNGGLLDLQSTAFLCSRSKSPAILDTCRQWAAQFDGSAVFGGFQSPGESATFEILLQRKIPVVYFRAQALYHTIPAFMRPHYDAGRLLIVSTAPFYTTPTSFNAKVRNALVALFANRVVFGYIAPGSDLRTLYDTYPEKATLLMH